MALVDIPSVKDTSLSQALSAFGSGNIPAIPESAVAASLSGGISEVTNIAKSAQALLGSKVGDISSQLASITSKFFSDTNNPTLANLKTEIPDPIKNILTSGNEISPGLFVTNPLTGGIDANESGNIGKVTDLEFFTKAVDISSIADRLGIDIPVDDAELSKLKDSAFKLGSSLQNAAGVTVPVAALDMESIASVDSGMFSDVLSEISKAGYDLNTKSISDEISDFMKSDIGMSLKGLPDIGLSIAKSYIPNLPNVQVLDAATNQFTSPVGMDRRSSYDTNYAYGDLMTNAFGFSCTGNYNTLTNYRNMQNGFNALMMYGIDKNMLGAISCIASMASPWLSDSTRKMIGKYLPSISKSSSSGMLKSAMQIASPKYTKSGPDLLRGLLSGGKVRSASANNLSNIGDIATMVGSTVLDTFKIDTRSQVNSNWDDQMPIIWDSEYMKSVPKSLRSHYVGNTGTKVGGVSMKGFMSGINNGKNLNWQNNSLDEMTVNINTSNRIFSKLDSLHDMYN